MKKLAEYGSKLALEPPLKMFYTVIPVSLLVEFERVHLLLFGRAFVTSFSNREKRRTLEIGPESEWRQEKERKMGGSKEEGEEGMREGEVVKRWERIEERSGKD